MISAPCQFYTSWETNYWNLAHFWFDLKLSRIKSNLSTGLQNDALGSITSFGNVNGQWADIFYEFVV